MKYDLSIFIFNSGSGHIQINASKYAFPPVLPIADYSYYTFKTSGFKTFWIRLEIFEELLGKTVTKVWQTYCHTLCHWSKSFQMLVGRRGLEPRTTWLKVKIIWIFYIFKSDNQHLSYFPYLTKLETFLIKQYYPKFYLNIFLSQCNEVLLINLLFLDSSNRIR